MTATQSTPELDRLAFLEGCWVYATGDWNLWLRWRREPDAWVGRYVTAGNMGPNRTTEMRIEVHDHLVISEPCLLSVLPCAETETTEPTWRAVGRQGDGQVLFEGGIELLRETADQLRFAGGEHGDTYLLERCEDGN